MSGVGGTESVVTSRLVPVPLYDASLRTPSGAAELELLVPPYDPAEEKGTFERKRASIDRCHRTVRAACLYPIIPELPLRQTLDTAAVWSEDPARWITAWKDALVHYTDARIDEAHYRRVILQGEPTSAEGGLGIFGRTRNPLEPVIRLAVAIHKPALLLHYVAVVVLQFYLSVHSLFVVVRTERGAPFHEGLTSHLFLMLREVHWKVTTTTPMSDVELTADNIVQETLRHSYPTLLLKVMRVLQRTHKDVATLTNLGARKDTAETFCMEKLRKNFMQALMCMRFREVVPHDFCARVNAGGGGGGENASPLGAVDCVIKYFPHPKAATIRTLDVHLTPEHTLRRLPQFWTHCFFTPHEPIFVLSDKELVGADALWKLLIYYPLSDFDKTVAVAARRVFNAMPEAPGASDLNPVRARYTYYVRDDRVYVFMPNLLLPPNSLAHDETSPAHISTHAWTWLANNVPSPPRFSVTNSTPIALAMIAHSPFLIFLHVAMQTGGSEAEAVEACRARGFTHEQVFQSYFQVRTQMCKSVPLEQRRAMRETWDMCSSVPPPPVPSGEEMAHANHVITCIQQHMLCPASAILLGDRPWIDRWRARERMPQLLQSVSDVVCKLARAQLATEVEEELKTNLPLCLSERHRAALDTYASFLRLHPDAVSAHTRRLLLPKLDALLHPPMSD